MGVNQTKYGKYFTVCTGTGHYVVYLKLTLCYMPIISQLKKKKPETN